LEPKKEDGKAEKKQGNNTAKGGGSRGGKRSGGREDHHGKEKSGGRHLHGLKPKKNERGKRLTKNLNWRKKGDEGKGKAQSVLVGREPIGKTVAQVIKNSIENGGERKRLAARKRGTTRELG